VEVQARALASGCRTADAAAPIAREVITTMRDLTKCMERVGRLSVLGGGRVLFVRERGQSLTGFITMGRQGKEQ
jgi:hypothetical protein